MSIGSVSDWRKAVARESHLHLLEFNDDKFLNGNLADAYEANELDDAYDRFDQFLRTSTPKHTCPQRALRAFYLEELDEVDIGTRGFDRMGAFVGRPTEGVDVFFALKPLRFLEDHMDKFGLEAVTARDISVEISAAVRSDPDSYTIRPEGNLRAEAKRRIDEKLKEIITEATTASTHAAMMTARSGPAVGTAFIPDPPEFSNDPIWVTSKEAVETSELGEVPDPGADALIKSAYAAGMKECLGLHNRSENLNDRERAEADPADPSAKPFDAFANFAISFLLEIDLSGGEPPSAFQFRTRTEWQLW